MNHALLHGWARQIECDAAGYLRAFELQQTRNLNHSIPVRVAPAMPCPRWLVDTAAVQVSGALFGTAPIAGDPYPPPVELHGNEIVPVADFSSMPPEWSFNLVPPPEAVTDSFRPPPSQFGGDEPSHASNRVAVCGFLTQAKLTNGVNDYQRPDSMELLLQVAPPPAYPLQVRLYGRHAKTYSSLVREGLALRVTGPLRIRTKAAPDGGVRRMLYLHCNHLRVPQLEELPYRPAWLASSSHVPA